MATAGELVESPGHPPELLRRDRLAELGVADEVGEPDRDRPSAAARPGVRRRRRRRGAAARADGAGRRNPSSAPTSGTSAPQRSYPVRHVVPLVVLGSEGRGDDAAVRQRRTATSPRRSAGRARRPRPTRRRRAAARAIRLLEVVAAESTASSSGTATPSDRRFRSSTSTGTPDRSATSGREKRASPASRRSIGRTARRPSWTAARSSSSATPSPGNRSSSPRRLARSSPSRSSSRPSASKSIFFAIGVSILPGRAGCGVAYDRRVDSQGPEELPIFELPLAIVPAEQVPLHIFEERYRLMIAHCLEEDAPFGIVFPDDYLGARAIGCSAHVAEVLERYEDGRLDIVVTGSERSASSIASTPTTGRPPTSRPCEPSGRDRSRAARRAATRAQRLRRARRARRRRARRRTPSSRRSTPTGSQRRSSSRPTPSSTSSSSAPNPNG